jgi:hypothetical protein
VKVVVSAPRHTSVLTPDPPLTSPCRARGTAAELGASLADWARQESRLQAGAPDSEMNEPENGLQTLQTGAPFVQGDARSSLQRLSGRTGKGYGRD